MKGTTAEFVPKRVELDLHWTLTCFEFLYVHIKCPSLLVCSDIVIGNDGLRCLGCHSPRNRERWLCTRWCRSGRCCWSRLAYPNGTIDWRDSTWSTGVGWSRQGLYWSFICFLRSQLMSALVVVSPHFLQIRPCVGSKRLHWFL